MYAVVTKIIESFKTIPIPHLMAAVCMAAILVVGYTVHALK